MKKEFVLFFVFTLFVSTAQAETVLNSLDIGMNKSEISSAFIPCENDLCGEVLFGNSLWQGRYIFENDILAAIGISAPTSDASVDALFNGLEDSPYVLAYAESNSGSYNIVSQMQEGKEPEDVSREYQQWVNTIGHDNSYILYLYIETQLLNYLIDNPAENVGGNSSDIFTIIDVPNIESSLMTIVSITDEETRLISGTKQTILQRMSEVRESIH